MNVLKSMGIQSRHLEMSVILQVSAVEVCPLSSIPLYFEVAKSWYIVQGHTFSNHVVSTPTCNSTCTYNMSLLWSLIL